MSLKCLTYKNLSWAKLFYQYIKKVSQIFFWLCFGSYEQQTSGPSHTLCVLCYLSGLENILSAVQQVSINIIQYERGGGETI